MRDLGLVTSVMSAVVLVVLALCWDGIRTDLHLESDLLLWLLAGTTVVTCLRPIIMQVSQGLGHHYRIVLGRLLSPIARLIAIVLLLDSLQVAGYVAGNFAASLTSFAILFWGVARYVAKGGLMEGYKDRHREMLVYMGLTALTIVPVAAQKVAEPWVIRSSLSAADSAGYYIATMFGNIPLWLTQAVVPFIFPFVSERFEKGLSTSRMHLQTLAFVLLVGGGVTLFLAFAGAGVLGLRSSWGEYVQYAPFMWQTALVATLSVLLNCHAIHEAACKRFGFLLFLVPLVLCELAILSPGASGVLLGPKGFVTGLFVSSSAPELAAIVAVMLATRGVIVAGVIIQRWRVTALRGSDRTDK